MTHIDIDGLGWDDDRREMSRLRAEVAQLEANHARQVRNKRVGQKFLAEARAEVTRLREALEKIAALNLPYRDTAKLARHIARGALDGKD